MELIYLMLFLDYFGCYLIFFIILHDTKLCVDMLIHHETLIAVERERDSPVSGEKA